MLAKSPRAWPIIFNRQVCPDVLEIPSWTGRLRGGICRYLQGLGKAESWASAAASELATPPLVEYLLAPRFRAGKQALTLFCSVAGLS